MRGFVLIFRILSVALLIWLIAMVGVVYQYSLFDIGQVAVLLGDLRDLLSYYIYLGLGFLFQGIASLVVSLFSALIPGFNHIFYFRTAMYFFYYIVGRQFYFPDLEADALPTLENISSLSVELSFELGPDLYIAFFQVLVIIMFIFAIQATLKSDPGLSIKVCVMINLIIIIPLFLMGFQRILFLFTINLEWLDQILAMNVLSEGIQESISDNFWEFLGSEIFLLAMANFMYLEFSFQSAYIDEVTSPSIEREQRLTNQIKYLKQESQKAVASLEQMEKQRQKERLEQLKLVEKEKGLGEVFQSEHMKLSSFMSEKGTGQFSYISELIEKKNIEKEEKRLERAMKSTRQLSFFLDKLFSQDEESFDSLTAKTSAPSSSGLTISTVINVAFRFFAIVILTYICVHPQWFFEGPLNVPPSISMSVEMLTPEAILSIFVPFLLVFPMVSAIIRATKHQKLNERLKLEELRRKGLTEEEYTEIQRRNQADTMEDAQFESEEDAEEPPVAAVNP